MRFAGGMIAKMGGQCLFGGKRSTTLVTSMRTILRVGKAMGCKVGLLGKRSTTLVTLVRLDTGMDQAMVGQRFPGDK